MDLTTTRELQIKKKKQIGNEIYFVHLIGTFCLQTMIKRFANFYGHIHL